MQAFQEPFPESKKLKFWGSEAVLGGLGFRYNISGLALLDHTTYGVFRP
jgi:hypothetical protein